MVLMVSLLCQEERINMKPVIYYSHAMEHAGKLLADCGKRAYDMRVILSDVADIWVPEDNQSKTKSEQQKIDLDALVKCDILLVDLYHFGLVIGGEPVWGQGTNQEVGFIKAANVFRKKKVPIIQIMRTSRHPFMVEGSYEDYGVTKNCRGFDEACDYIRKICAK